MIKFKKILQKASSRAAGAGWGGILLTSAPEELPDKKPREEFASAAQPPADAAEAPQADAESKPVVENREEAAQPGETAEAPQADAESKPVAENREEAAQPGETTTEDYTVDDDLVNRVLGDIFEESPDEEAEAQNDSPEARTRQVEGDEPAPAQAAANVTETGDRPAEGEGEIAREVPADADFVQAPDDGEVEDVLKEADDLTETGRETEVADTARPEESGEVAQAEPPAAGQTPEGDQADTTGREIADLVDEITEIGDMISGTLDAGGDAGEPAEAQDQVRTGDEGETAQPQAGGEPAEPAEPAEAQAVEEEPGDDSEKQAPEETAQDAGEVGDSVMAEVDRLLSELGQISLPDEVQDAPTPGAAEGKAGAAPAESDETETVTAREREALLSEEGVDGEEALQDDLARKVSQEVDHALGEVTRIEQTDDRTTELEIDFTPEAVGIEEDTEPSVEKEEDVDDMLSSLLAEVDNLDLPDEVDSRPEEAPEEDDSMSQLLGGPDAMGEEPPSPAEERDSKDDDIEGAQGGRAGGADTAEEGSDEVGYEFASELDISGDELVDQALAEALGGDSADETDYDAADDAFEDSEENEDDDDADDGSDAEPAKGEAATEGDDEALLKNLEDSMDSAAAEGEEEGFAEASESDIQQEVVKRSRDVEQAVLDELFGTGTEDFEREIKTELANIGEEKDRDVRDQGDAPPESAGDEKSAEVLPDDSPHRLRLGLLWLAYQMNRPFTRWLSPARLRNLALLAIGLLSTGFVSLAMALALLLRGQ